MPIMLMYDYDDDFDDLDYIEEYGDIQHECKDCKHYYEKEYLHNCVDYCRDTNARVFFDPIVKKEKEDD